MSIDITYDKRKLLYTYNNNVTIYKFRQNFISDRLFLPEIEPLKHSHLTICRIMHNKQQTVSNLQDVVQDKVLLF